MSDHSGRGGIYEGPDGTPLYGDGREVDSVDTSKWHDKPAATVHGTESGDATFCKNCGKPIVEDTSGRGWRHGETGPYVCSETYAQPGGAPSVSPTVTPGGETADHVRDYILPIYESRAKIMAAVGYHDFAKDKCECGGCWLYRQLERLGDALTLLQAAETKL